jgi:hypothetical protein
MGHLMELLTMLDNEPNTELGIIPWSEWVVQSSNSLLKKEKIDSKVQG